MGDRPTFVKVHADRQRERETPAVGEMHNIMNSLREKEEERKALPPRPPSRQRSGGNE